MFFIGLTLTFVLLLSGIILVFQNSFAIGGVFVVSGFAVFSSMFHFYHSKSVYLQAEEHNPKKKEEESEEPFWSVCLDCSTPNNSILDCKSGSDTFDCNCD